MTDIPIPPGRRRAGRWSGAWYEWPFATPMRKAFLVIVGLLAYGVTAGYHAFTSLVQIPADTLSRAVFNISVTVCYGIIFVLMARFYGRRETDVLRVFWATLLSAVVIFGILGFVPVLSSAGTYSPSTGLPENVGTMLRVVMLSPVLAVFSFSLLFRFQKLALFKRTRRSVRQWYLMIATMTAASVSMFGTDPGLGVNVFAGVFLAVSIVLMVANAFRLSRIVYLSLKEKILTIALSIGLIVVLILALTSNSSGLFLGRSNPFLWKYSPALSLFVLQCVLFGLIYSLTVALSMLFHLPTSSEFEQKAGELAALHSVARLTGDALNRDTLAATIIASPVEAGVGDSAWLVLTEPQSGSLKPRLVASRNITSSRIHDLLDVEALYEEAVSRGEALLLNQATVDHRVRARPGDGVSSLLVVPLLARKEALGALFVAKEISQGFEDDDVETIATFADQAALTLDNARLFEEQLEKERLSRELVIAREVQRKLLPQELPNFEELKIAASSVSAQEVGGDYYDFVQLTPTQWAIIVGDVSGKGTSAAFYMAELKGVFRALSRLTTSPCEFLEHANHALANSMERSVFISVVYGLLDLEKRHFTLARAGHCPVIHAGRNGEVKLLRTSGLGLGLDRSSLFGSVLEEVAVPLHPGDVFVLYTDGVTESRSERGEEYGYDRLVEAVLEHHDRPVNEIHTSILADLNRFLGRAAYDDDMTLVVMRWDGPVSDRPDDMSKADSAPSAYVSTSAHQQPNPRTAGDEVQS